MSQHTPGPWRYDSGKIWTPRGWWVASVYEDMEEDIKGANGLLLAAAPDLLAHLEFAVKLLEGISILNATAQVDAMRAVVARARGEA